PNSTVAAFTPGVSCGTCNALVSGSPLVTTTSATDGSFILQNVPCGVNIPVVIQVGRWRRQVVVPSVACCTNTAMSAAMTRLPRNQSEGDIPLLAVTTGNGDPLECLLLKIGIDPAEFTLPSGNGRVRMYRDNGVNQIGTSTLPLASTLYDNTTEMQKYDSILL